MPHVQRYDHTMKFDTMLTVKLYLMGPITEVELTGNLDRFMCEETNSQLNLNNNKKSRTAIVQM